MCGSQVNGKSNIKDWLYEHKSEIRTIVDIGVGSATYPKLLGKDDFHFIGIEIWEPYVKMFSLNEWYKKIIIGDVRLLDLPKGDCIIFGDILEHLPKKDALEVLRKAYKAYRHLVLSIPVNEDGSIVYSKIHFSNPFEEHKSGWTVGELKKMFKWDDVITSGGIGIFLK